MGTKTELHEPVRQAEEALFCGCPPPKTQGEDFLLAIYQTVSSTSFSE
jgi:hypothetical protein